MKFQVIAVQPKAGIARGSQKPYSMLIVDGIFTDAEGVMSTAEVAFFMDTGKPAPVIVPGKVYEPIIKVAVSRDKKLTAYIESFQPVRADVLPKAA